MGQATCYKKIRKHIRSVRAGTSKKSAVVVEIRSSNGNGNTAATEWWKQGFSLCTTTQWHRCCDNVRYNAAIWLINMGQSDVIHKTGSTQRIAAPSAARED